MGEGFVFSGSVEGAGMHRNSSAEVLRVTLYAIMLILSVMVVYTPSLDGPFLFDDEANIVDNGFIQLHDITFESLKKAATAPHPNKRRVLPNLSFGVQYAIHGFQVRGYHVVNIAIHILCALFLYVFTRQLLHIDWLRERYGANAPWISWLVAFAWALHPIQINAVSYIVQRMTSMSVLFALCALCSWMAARSAYLRGHRLNACLWCAASLSSWLLGLLSKENILILPLLALITEFFLFRKADLSLPRRYRAVILALSLFIVAGIAISLPGLFQAYDYREFTPWQRLMTQSRVLWHYISLFIVPISDRFVLLYDYPLSMGLFSPLTTFFAMASWISLPCLLFHYRKRFPVAAWAIYWYIAAHLVESTILPLEIAYEHRMYLPSIALVIAGILLLHDGWREFRMNSSLTGLGIIAVLVILGGATYTRNLDFKDAVTFHKAELKNYPNSFRIRLSLALSYNRHGEYEKGGALLEALVKDYPRDLLALQNWYFFQDHILKEKERAEATLQFIIQLIDTGHYRCHPDGPAVDSLASYMESIGRYDDALKFIDILLRDFSHFDSIWYRRGKYLAGLGKWGEALTAFERAKSLNPEDPPILFWIARCLIELGNHSEGCALLHSVMATASRHEAAGFASRLFQEKCN